ncbi:MAG: hypothetical protein OYH77_03565 [Pseudomonadota bacterium]|nr:hypothetical protein [Pseudomonadota bacterium]
MNKKHHIASFTLIETMVALGLLATLILQVANVQGRAFYFSDYGQNLTQATWLAKRIMAQVEYYWYDKEFEDLDSVRIDAKPFEGQEEFSYNLKIDEWALPLANVLGANDPNAEPNPMIEIVKQQVDQIFGGHIMKLAHVEVFWSEGAVRESTALTLLLTNQRKIGEAIATLEAMAQPKPKPKPKKKRNKKSANANKK